MKISLLLYILAILSATLCVVVSLIVAPQYKPYSLEFHVLFITTILNGTVTYVSAYGLVEKIALKRYQIIILTVYIIITCIHTIILLEKSTPHIMGNKTHPPLFFG